MMQGLTLNELAEELARQNETKKDFVADTKKLTFTDESKLALEDFGDFPVTEFGHGQIAAAVGVPVKYYRRMLDDAPELLAENVNHWFENDRKQRMVRTMDGGVRAFLSDRYRLLDHIDLVESVLPVISEANADIVSCQVTERNLFLKVVIPDVQAEIGPPEGYKWGEGGTDIDIVQPGIVIANSEVGASSLWIRPSIHTVKCTNLMVYSDASLKKYHIGERIGVGEEGIWEYFSDETKIMTNKVLWAQIKDLTVAALQGEAFNDMVNKLRQARGHEIDNPIKVIENLESVHPLTDDENGSVLAYLLGGKDFSRYGLANAVTRASADAVSYDRATEMEVIGGNIIEWDESRWLKIAA